MHEVYVLHTEAAPVEIRQNAAVRRKAKAQRVGVERLKFAVIALVELAVFAVAEQGMPRRRHLRADLVRAPGDELTLHERQPVPTLERFIERHGGLCAGLRLLGDVDAVFLRILK